MSDPRRIAGVIASVSDGGTATTITVTAYRRGPSLPSDTDGRLVVGEPLVADVGNISGVPHVVVVTLTPAEAP
jgi:hypothetical protein